MGKKKSNSAPEKKNSDNGDREKKDANNALVFKVHLHCEGCASKILKSTRNFEGVESVKLGDGDKVAVTGKVDPVKLREYLERKTKREVQLISPLPKKEKDKENDNQNEKKNKDGGGGGGEKKSKEPPVTTAVLKVDLHCEGCIQKIHRVVTKTKGYVDMNIDRQKDLVTVKGTMDMKALAESLKGKLKKPVEIVPPKKEGGENNEKGGGGGGGGGGDGRNKAEANNPYVYGPVYLVDHIHAPLMFSDENPNACSIM